MGDPAPAQAPTQATVSGVTVDDGVELSLWSWLPSGEPKAVLQVVHGMEEHALRYGRLAQRLTAAGFAVYAHDQRGHGRTAGAHDLGFIAEHRGFGRLVDDVHAIHRTAARKHPGVPMFLMGHSMGSVVSQGFLFGYSRLLAGAVLSAPPVVSSAAALAGAGVCRLERLRVGSRGHSKLLKQLIFGGYNVAFRPNRTAFDWLSRDRDEVDKYVADPLCGFGFTVGAWGDLFEGLLQVARDSERDRVRKDLPMYLFAGGADPVSGEGKGVSKLAQAYRDQGVADVVLRVYPDGRHESLNETNRDQVEQDLVGWLEAHLPSA